VDKFAVKRESGWYQFVRPGQLAGHDIDTIICAMPTGAGCPGLWYQNYSNIF
jgi:hypothetical protein